MEQKEYIERDKAIDTVACKPGMTPDERYGVIKRIRAIPSADVREVVFCRDCINKETSACANAFICTQWGVRVWPDDYCSRGERPNCGADMRGK